ncbi:helix-hairpin-helix domain-containing protein [Marinisporobacter balticus]|uniref:Competence protein ComEA n=1 Tax=Marinisporobacter balticus TaxID=2018667 RepID=A0A4R2KYQ8_9FIRM|nr:helix-hairpin-helix domain-containing protein [Marinisporobacter balticus]TCO79033.1 competence protein ComEA [Marinisporobacter balticus]
MQKFTKREVMIIGTFIMVVVLFLFTKYYMNGSKEFVLEQDNEKTSEIETVQETHTNDEQEIKEEKWIIVDVCGEIKNPGIVKVKEGDRVADGVKLVGGLLDTADRRQINMARILLDGEQIYIPKIGENITGVQQQGTQERATNTNNKVNINTASKDELESLNGIGNVLAERIIEYRAQYGRFENINAITNVPGLGEKKFQGIKEHIVTN